MRRETCAKRSLSPVWRQRVPLESVYAASVQGVASA
jgi:hypothetical protein